MKLQTSKKNICFESRKRTQKQAQKDMDGMEWHKIEYLILSAMRMRKRHLICTSSHYNRMKNNKSSTRGLSLEMSVLARARAKLLNMLYISTHMSVPHGEIIKKTVLYI